ncbi:hypothetical protein Poly24_08570 [Rosistilla carotiformis]|uniref:Uncharacterized protein n=1 Tax=Rosistilla carotiformis TaxID=2528017 RepID=A0A518JNP1_9BACT|nr:hypothetical protein [Rosistilla carotiformis]QDV67165.1 hypothetical protein Poly24_08570 [Rosistilla carotiformis]
MSDEQKEIIQIGLTEKESADRAGLVEELLTDLKEALPGVFTDLSSSGRTWFKGKSAQEAARAQQILSEVLDKIGRFKLDEREQDHRHRQESELHSIDVKQKQAELYLSSLERATKLCRELTEMGVDVDIRAVLAGMDIHINSLPEIVSSTAAVPRIDAEKSK